MSNLLKYRFPVIPAKAGIQIVIFWMPDQVRHDDIRDFI